MTTNDRCPVCDRPVATAEQWARVERDESIPAAEGAAVCWGEGEPRCTMARVDWRAQALAAEAERDEARALIGAVNRGDVPLCEECGTALAMQYDDNGNPVCDAHAGGIVCRRDLQHADALRAAIGSAPREAPAVLTVRPAATQAERDRDMLSALAGALLVERAVAAEYAASEGRPWAERIAVKARLDAARAAVQARMAATEGGR